MKRKKPKWASISKQKKRKKFEREIKDNKKKQTDNKLPKKGKDMEENKRSLHQDLEEELNGEAGRELLVQKKRT